MTTGKRVVIAGGGVGGLATAIRLQARGFSVVVLEKNATVGGRANVWEQDGFRFDTGPTLLLMPDVYAELWQWAGRRLADDLELRQLRPNYRVSFDDGASLLCTPDAEEMAANVERFEPGAGARFPAFMQSAGYKYQLSRQRFINRDFDHWWQFATPRNLVELFKTEALRRLFHVSKRYFHDERLRLALTFQTMYLGISPLDAPAVYALLPYTELAEGIWYPKGGIYALITAMRRLAEDLGVEVCTSTEVTGLQFAGRTVSGVQTEDGKTVPADIVVANIDLPTAYRTLVPAERRRKLPNKRLGRMRYTASAYMLYLGVDRRYEQLDHHNVFMSNDFRANFDSIFKSYTLPDHPSLYVNVPNRSDPGHAPAGCDALYVLVPVPHLGRGPIDWQRDEPAFRQRVLDRLEGLGLKDLRQHIVVERSVTPLDWRAQFGLARGAAFGLAHDFLQVGYLRPANHATGIDNLYFVGASTTPGTGVPLVIMGSRLVAERIIRKHGVRGDR